MTFSAFARSGDPPSPAHAFFVGQEGMWCSSRNVRIVATHANVLVAYMGGTCFKKSAASAFGKAGGCG